MHLQVTQPKCGLRRKMSKLVTCSVQQQAREHGSTASHFRAIRLRSHLAAGRVNILPYPPCKVLTPWAYLNKLNSEPELSKSTLEEDGLKKPQGTL